MNQNHIVPENQSNVVSPKPMPAQGGKKKIWVAAGLSAVVVLLACGLIAYAQSASPTRVWQKFATAAVFPKVVTETSDFSYVDNGKLTGDATQNPLAAMFSNVALSASSTAYVDTTDAANPEMSMDMTYSFGSGGTSISSTANMIMMGQDIYINFGNNPLLIAFCRQPTPGNRLVGLKSTARK